MFERIGALLPKTLRQHRLEHPVNARQLLAQIEQQAQEFVPQGKYWARRVGADGWIVVEVDHAGTAQLLTPHLKTLVGQLHRQFPRLTFKGIRLRVKL